jgi:putative ABC transport system permease protein
VRTEAWLYKIPLLVRSLFRRKQVEDELDDELHFHLEQEIEKHLARGLSRTEAQREARRALGDIERLKARCKDVWIVTFLDMVVRDVKYGIRCLRKDSGFALGVFLLLSLSIGASVTIGSIVNQILLKSLPYADPHELVIFHESLPESADVLRSVNVLHYLEWRKCECFDDVALAQFVYDVNLASAEEPERVPSLRVTPNTFSLLGVRAQIGRLFSPGSEPTAQDGVIISDSLWRGRFGADPDIVGRRVELDAMQGTIVGVLPPSFRFDWALANSGTTHVDVYRVWDLEPRSRWNWTFNYTFAAIGRLADGVTLDAARAAVDTMQSAIADEHFEGPWASTTLRATVTPLSSWVTRDSRSGLLLLLAGVVIAFVVACLNVANLMLVRASTRVREAGVRSALGATRLALVRTLVVESGVLALAGTVAGIAIGHTGLRVLQGLAGIDLPRLEGAQVGWQIYLGGFVFAVFATVVFGLLPALGVSRVDPQAALRPSGRTATDSSAGLRLRQSLVGVEVALTSSLLIVAGLMLVSYAKLDTVDRGFDAPNVLTAEIGLPVSRYTDNDSRLQFYETVLADIRARSKVMAAGVTSVLPLQGQRSTSTAIRAGTVLTQNEQPVIDYRFVSPGYFEAMGITLLRGRAIDTTDYGESVGIFSERASEIVFGSTDSVGERYYTTNSNGGFFEVIGVVPDVHSRDLVSNPDPIVYEPLTGAGALFPVVSIAVRTEADPRTAAEAIRSAVRSVDPSLSISKLQTMQNIEGASLGERRLRTGLLAGFAVAALMIAALGTYSVMAFVASTRNQELAIRMALGARRATVATMLLIQGMRPVSIGLCAGMLAALLAGRAISSMLYNVAPIDAVTWASVLVVMVICALAACVLPAWRASQTSLTRLLRES